MEDYQQLWNSCLEMIREKYGYRFRHWFDVWYGDVRFESYDPDSHTLIIQVPSKYVYEYLEMNGIKDIRWATQEVFKTSIVLQYRIIAKEPSFAEVAAYLQQQGYDSRHDPYRIAIPNARHRMEEGLAYWLKGKEQWLPGYDNIVDWLTDNRGRGLLVVGTTGLGKSLICQKILPVILAGVGRPIPCVSATSLRDRFKELLSEPIVIIDDLGKEPRKHFGDTDNSFFELCNNAERTGNLLIITTNLSTTPVTDQRYPDSIQNRYGAEVLDRLKVITALAIVKGGSLRGNK